MKLHMFRTLPLSIIRSFPLYTAVVYVIQFCWHIPLLCVQWKTPDDGQRKCPKHVDFHSNNKFEKLVHLVGFIIRNLSRYTVTWTSKSFTFIATEHNEALSRKQLRICETYCSNICNFRHTSIREHFNSWHYEHNHNPSSYSGIGVGGELESHLTAD